MTNEHLITPPPELVHQWVDMLSSRSDQAVFTMAAQWGADQELEACCEWLECNYNYPQVNHPLRGARRPEPLSLKEQALSELEEIMTELHDETGSAFTASAIRRALEALDD
jgi:hypothetical protein